MSAAFQQEVLKQLRDNGSDIAKPHGFEFYIYLSTQPLADKAADKIRQCGFSGADVSPSACGT